MPGKQALDGVTVLDCSQILAGPFCSMHLSDMGANIIKVEKPGGGDDTRRMGPPFIAGESAGFIQLNRNKRSIVLNFRAESGKDAFIRLAQKADVLIENYRPGTMDRLGLGYDDLSQLNPSLIYCSISGFGRTGPYAKRAGFDLIAQGMSGIMSFNGMPDSPPVKVGVPLADLNAGMFALSGILTAYIHRLKTGEGQHIEVSLLESALSYSVWESSSYFATGDIPGPLGSTHRLSAPYQAIRTADGYLNIGAPNQANWERLVRAIGREELLADNRFKDNPSRLGAKTELNKELEITFVQHPRSHWMNVLEDAGVPAGPILDMKEVWSNEQIQARNMDVQLEHKTAGIVRNIGIVAKLSVTPGAIERSSPLLGEHTDEILEFAGYSQAQIQSLRAEGIAGPDALISRTG